MEITKPNLSFDEWRKKTIRVFYVLVALIFTVEVGIYIAFNDHGLLGEILNDIQYITEYVAFPTLINLLLVTICNYINKLSIKAQIKNYVILITLSLFAAVVAFIHYDVSAILTTFSLPVFLTILFGQKRMTGAITVFNLILLVLSTIHSASYSHSIYFYLNATVAYAVLVSAYLLSSVLIAYNKANSDYIYESYQTQLSLNEQARNDSLTGLYNQKTFQSLLKSTMDTAKNHKTPMSLAIIDLDDFKDINDTFGHLEGDQVLLQFTNLIRQQCIDGEAYVSRYGGDEFAVIFPKASKELAFLRLETLRQRCRQVPQSKVRSGEISFSAGISHYMEGEMDANLLFHQADSALYQAKENGKGQTVVYPYS
ncbi:MAG: GGDEF domain-containing protein [Eubacteriales bacterium]|nr:GGDEF domain-containing protein [Eubacteriales bacterium]